MVRGRENPSWLALKIGEMYSRQGKRAGSLLECSERNHAGI